MEWVETTGRTIEEAKSIALDQLGVAEDDAEFDILEEPRPGLFGRVRGEARVRARVRPTTPRPKLDRRTRAKKGEGKTSGETEAAGGSDTTADAAPEVARSTPKPSRESKSGAKPKVRSDSDGRTGSRPAPTMNDKEITVDAQQVGDEAARFIDGLVTAFGLSGVTTAVVEGDDIEVKVEGADLGLLVGPRGTTLQAVQELARVAAQRRLGDHETRLRVDVGGYRERRREALSRFAHQVATQVVADGTAKSLEPMMSADRKIVHDSLADFEGVVTSSAGEEPNRRVVVSPANG